MNSLKFALHSSLFFLKGCRQATILIGPKNDGGTYFSAEDNKSKSSEASRWPSKFVFILSGWQELLLRLEWIVQGCVNSSRRLEAASTEYAYAMSCNL